ncbi:MAG: PAS domain S-box protein [Janthinobacterium lividum]
MPELAAATPSPTEPGLGADQLLDALPWGLLEVSAAGIIRRLNRQAAAWWGVPAEAALGQTIEQVGPGQLPAPAYAALGHAASEPTEATECYLLQTEQWVTLTSAEQPTGEVVVHWQDSTAAHRRTRQYQALAENIPDVLTRWDPNLRLLYANPAFAAQASQPLPALLGRTFAEMALPAEVTGPYQAVLQRVFDTGQPQEHYHTLLSPQGPVHYHSRLVPELRDGQIDTVLGIARDISALKRTEAETLRLREAVGQQATDRYQALLYALDEGFCVLELTFDAGGQQAVDYVYRELNPVFARQSGLSAEVLGQSIRTLMPDLEPFWFDTYGRVARTGEPVRLEHEVPQLGRWFELHACRVGGPGSRQVAVLFNDITDRKHTAATLRRAAATETFRLHLADALGPLTDAVAIQEAVTHRARLHFAADRCYYCEVAGGQAIIRRDAAAAGLPSVAGTYPLADFALLQAVIEAGRPFVVPDVRQDESVDENLRQLCVQLQVISYLNVPVVKNGAAVGVLCLVQCTPRAWTAADVDLATEVAERTWTAVERARAEAALRDSEARLQVAVDAAELGTFVWHVVEDRTEEDARARVHFGLVPGSTVPLAEALVTTFHPDDAPRYAAAVAHATDPAGPGTLYEEFRVRHPDGQQRWLAVSAAAAFAGTPRAAVRLTGVLADITARKQHEANLALLAEIVEDFARLASEAELMQAIGERLAHHLQLDGITFCDVDEARESVTINYNWNAADVPQIVGTFRFADYVTEEFAATMRTGKTWVVGDTQHDARTDAQAMAALRVGAVINVPYLRRGEWQGYFTAMSRVAREWTADETALIQEVSNRTFLRLERARAEQALRRSEDIYRTLFDSMDEGYCLVEVLLDENGRPADVLHLEVNQAHQRKSGLGNIVGQRLLDFMPEVEPEWLDFYGNVALTGRPARLEYRVDALGRWFTSHASRVGGEGSRLVAIIFDDITARKHHEQRQQFLLQLSDRLRPLADPLAVQQAALQWVGEQLGLDRLLFNEIDPDVTTYTVRASYVRAGFLAYGGQQPMGPFTESVRALQQGITKVVCDVETDESFSPEEKAICASIQVRAFVTVPLVKGGRWLINLVAHASQPRSWPPHEVALLEEVAERTWAAVERAKVEDALRGSEAQLRSFVTASSDTLYRMSANWQQMHSLQSKDDFMVPTEAPSETWLTRYIPPADQPAVQAAIQAAIAGRHFFELEHRVFRADGAVGWTFSRAVPVLGPQGELVEWFGMATDITARKTAEDAQRRSEERLRLALDAAELGTWDWDINANEVRWNDRHFTMLGLEPRPGPLTPDDFAQAVHPDDRPRVLQRLQAAVDENHRFEAKFRIVTPQDDIRWISGHGQPTEVAPDGHVQRMSGVLLDVTERKYAEEHLQALAASLERQVARRTQALQESQLLLQSVYDTTLVGLAVLHAVRDEATGAITDFTFISANKELARLSGRPDLVGRRYGPEFTGGEASDMLARMAQAVETGQPQQSEFFYSVAGVLRWAAFMCVKLDGGVVVTLLDITERKHAEQQLTRNLRLLEQAETVAQLGSWDYDLATGQFYWSGGMYDLFGLPLGQPVQPAIYLDYVLAEDRPQAKQLVRQITVGAGDIETTLRLQVGAAVKTVRIKSVVLRDAAGQAVRVLGVDLDLSELHRLEADNLRLRLSQQQALFEAVQAAEEAERRRMSESLHNGIGQLLYATKLQLDRLPDAPVRSPQQEAARLLGEAIRQTRTLSHELTPAILEEFGLEKTLRSICSTLNTPSLRWRCHLAFEGAPALPLPLQLAVYRLAQELAQNVLKHAQATEATLEVDVLLAWVVLRVEDNGRGFDPSQTGGGLGLRSLRSRAALLGGSVHLTTAPGQGTQCQVRIPLPPLS